MIVMLPPVGATIILFFKAEPLKALYIDGNALVIFGIFGQLLFNLRFLYQLYYSERKKYSVLPSGFWWISIFGAIVTLIYAIFRRDIVLIVAQSFSLIPYFRNVMIGLHNLRSHKHS
jgi:lipid-A-disaccharide synthase-like uncharacterized protein